MKATATSLRPFGKTGLSVPPLGFGAGHVGGPDLDEAEAGRILNAAVDLGLTLVDTAPGYGLAEERIGRHLAHRRDELVLVTKGGYGVPGVPDWTAEVIVAGVDQALRRLRTDRIDVFLLHSCPVDVLARGEVPQALADQVKAGKVRVAGYAGENDPLSWALDFPGFGAIETSVNLADQRGIRWALPRAAERGLGVIAKRPMANAPWRFADRPTGHYAEPYWDRLQAMGLTPPEGMGWEELALRFAAYAPGVSCAIVGSANVEHLRRNAELTANGPLPEEVVSGFRAAFDRADPGDWAGQI